MAEILNGFLVLSVALVDFGADFKCVNALRMQANDRTEVSECLAILFFVQIDFAALRPFAFLCAKN